MSPIRTAVLPVAGLGTRFLPVTKAVPKEMLPLLDRPCIDYIVAEAVEAGIERIVFVTARGKDALVDYFDRSPDLESHLEQTGKTALLARVREAASRAEVVSVRQRVTLGLGHAVLTARAVIGDEEPFAVLLGDDVIFGDTPAIGQLIAQQGGGDQAVVALLEVPRDQTDRYGVCAGEWQAGGRLMQVREMIEKPRPEEAPSCHAIVGRYVLPAGIFEILARLGPGRGGEIQLTDALAVLAAQGRVQGLVFSGERHDTGNVLGLLRAALFAARRDPALWPGLQAILEELSPP